MWISCIEFPGWIWTVVKESEVGLDHDCICWVRGVDLAVDWIWRSPVEVAIGTVVESILTASVEDGNSMVVSCYCDHH